VGATIAGPFDAADREPGVLGHRRRTRNDRADVARIGDAVSICVDSIVARRTNIAGVWNGVRVFIEHVCAGQTDVATVRNPITVPIDPVVGAWARVAEVGRSVTVVIKSIMETRTRIVRGTNAITVGVVRVVEWAEVTGVGETISVGVRSVVFAEATIDARTDAVFVRIIWIVEGARIAGVRHQVTVGVRSVVAAGAHIVIATDLVAVWVGARVDAPSRLNPVADHQPVAARSTWPGRRLVQNATATAKIPHVITAADALDRLGTVALPRTCGADSTGRSNLGYQRQAAVTGVHPSIAVAGNSVRSVAHPEVEPTRAA
jgi:hypothetical protein